MPQPVGFLPGLGLIGIVGRSAHIRESQLLKYSIPEARNVHCARPPAALSTCSLTLPFQQHLRDLWKRQTSSLYPLSRAYSSN
jgi:hypothetical protein